ARGTRVAPSARISGKLSGNTTREVCAMAASTELFSTAEAIPFGRRQRRVRGARIPVTVVTGFLGSGKTTLIRELLRRPEGANTAHVIKQYCDRHITHPTLRASSDATVLLGNGCVCCTVR